MRVVCQMLVHTSRALPVCVCLAGAFSISLQRPLLPSMRVQTRSPDRIQLPLAQQGNRRPHSMLWRIVSGLQQNSLPIHMFAESISLPGSFNFHNCPARCPARSHVRAQVLGFSHQYRTLSKPPVPEGARSDRGAFVYGVWP